MHSFRSQLTLETLEVARQQAQQDASPESAQILRIADLRVEIAQHDKFVAEKEATRMSEILAEVVEDVKQTRGIYYCPRGSASWAHLERPPIQHEITAENLHSTLLLSRKEAAAFLGIFDQTTFKRVHRELGVDGWSPNDVRNR